MESVMSALGALSWGAIIAIGIVIVLLIVVFIIVLRQAIRSSRRQ
jgi:hypothetical protein